MAIKYRSVSGSFEESMENVITFDSEQLMKEFIVTEYNALMDTIAGGKYKPIDVDDVVVDIDHIHDDARNGWKDTRYVCLKRGYGKDYMKEYGRPQIVGFCATLFPQNIAADIECVERN